MTQANAYLTQFADQANVESRLDFDLFKDVGIRHWSMDQGKRICYQKDDSHTLSIYLKGGEKNYRSDATDQRGAPGRICLMSQGQSSEWEIKNKVEFVHLYFTDTLLKRYAAASFDIDVRFIELTNLLFQEDRKLQHLMHESFLVSRNTESYSPFFVEQSCFQVMHHLLEKYNGYQLHSERIKGGLSPVHIRFIREVIAEEMDKKLSIEKLAALIDLSPFHFARMFKLSFGESPANYITRIRIEKIKLLLGEKQSLAEISLQTGFNQQSHMTQHFKKLTGYTPAVYRQMIN